MGPTPKLRYLESNLDEPVVDIDAMEIFRAGKYPQGEYTPENIDEMIRAYDEKLHAAPLTIDHSDRGPAYGWVTRLNRIGDRLFATLRGVPISVYKALKNKRYRHRSVEIWRKFDETGGMYLKAVTLLGVLAPQVKGMEDLKLSTHMMTPAESVNFNDAEESESLPDIQSSNMILSFGATSNQTNVVVNKSAIFNDECIIYIPGKQDGVTFEIKSTKENKDKLHIASIRFNEKWNRKDIADWVTDFITCFTEQPTWTILPETRSYYVVNFDTFNNHPTKFFRREMYLIPVKEIITMDPVKKDQPKEDTSFNSINAKVEQLEAALGSKDKTIEELSKQVETERQARIHQVEDTRFTEAFAGLLEEKRVLPAQKEIARTVFHQLPHDCPENVVSFKDDKGVEIKESPRGLFLKMMGLGHDLSPLFQPTSGADKKTRGNKLPNADTVNGDLKERALEIIAEKKWEPSRFAEALQMASLEQMQS
jgi:hypothetical protein